ncbi:MAG: hypothetical protein JXR91_14380 [Deltaproteobacteria bacterium]|nr:hypothetical protein [Deltaproteobacteria bacterium]
MFRRAIFTLSFLLFIVSTQLFCSSQQTDILQDDTDTALNYGYEYPIIDIKPSLYSTDVPVDTVIKIRFDKQLDSSTVTDSVLHLESGPLKKWLMSYYNPLTIELMVWTSVDLNSNVDWVFSISAGMEFLDGTPVEPSILTAFTTGNSNDEQQPPFSSKKYEVVEKIFMTKCVSCHFNSDKAFTGIDFSSPDKVQNTVLNVRSSEWPSLKRVLPYKPGESYLLFKIFDNDYYSGQQMPRNIDSSKSSKPLTFSEQQDISDWIAGGALF